MDLLETLGPKFGGIRNEDNQDILMCDALGVEKGFFVNGRFWTRPLYWAAALYLPKHSRVILRERLEVCSRRKLRSLKPRYKIPKFLGGVGGFVKILLRTVVDYPYLVKPTEILDDEKCSVTRIAGQI